MVIGLEDTVTKIEAAGLKSSDHRRTNLGKGSSTWTWMTSGMGLNTTQLPTCMINGIIHLLRKDHQWINVFINSISQFLRMNTCPMTIPTWTIRFSTLLSKMCRSNKRRSKLPFQMLQLQRHQPLTKLKSRSQVRNLRSQTIKDCSNKAQRAQPLKRMHKLM